jgi:hypothetical protein
VPATTTAAPVAAALALAVFPETAVRGPTLKSTTTAEAALLPLPDATTAATP